MAESGDYDPGPWAGHNFASARRAYDAHAAGRGYGGTAHSSAGSGGTVASGGGGAKTQADVLEPRISTNATNPLVVICDVTSSMGKWPSVIFSKLPYLEHEAKNYLGQDLEIAFGAVGDAYSDRLPLQMRKFDSGPELANRMCELVIEQGGGGQMMETYELAALYAARNIDMPKAIKPVLIMIGDEKPYQSAPVDLAMSVANVEIGSVMTTAQIFKELKRKFSVYVIRKPYNDSGDNSVSAEDREIRAEWVSLVGADRVVDLPAAERVVDVIFGLLAHETDRVDEFKEEIEGRQKPDQVATVYKSLKTIITPDGSTAKGQPGQSIMKKLPPGKGPGRTVKGLLEE